MSLDPRYGLAASLQLPPLKKEEIPPPEVIFSHLTGSLYVRIVKVHDAAHFSLFMETSAPGNKDLLGVQIWSRCGMDGHVGILAQALFQKSVPFEGYTRDHHEQLTAKIQYQKEQYERKEQVATHALTAERTRVENMTARLREETVKVHEETRKVEEAYAQITELKKQLADYEGRLHNKGKGKVNGDHPFR